MSATVMVVEDEPDLMLTFRIVLRTAGYDVIEASSGEEALSVLGEVLPDAVILDLRLPGMDGWQVLSEIRGGEEPPAVPILIASANAGLCEQVRANELGCSELLGKPFSPEQLRESLARVLAGASVSSP